MVLTRSQTSRNKQLESENMEYFSVNDSDVTFPERDSRGAANNIERASLLDLERDYERIRYDQRLVN